ncbi:hypothetical protein GCM10010160_38230 [Acrocarpospora corrugata]
MGSLASRVAYGRTQRPTACDGTGSEAGVSTPASGPGVKQNPLVTTATTRVTVAP